VPVFKDDLLVVICREGVHPDEGHIQVRPICPNHRHLQLAAQGLHLTAQGLQLIDVGLGPMSV